MKTFKIVLISVVTIATVAAASFMLVNYLKPKPAGIKVISVPPSDVYINGDFMGQTPYSGTFPPSEINLKLIPVGGSQNLLTYETKIDLVPGIQTVVDREFGPTEDQSSETVVSFDKTGGNLAGMIIITTPDNSQVWIDGVSQGSSPYNFDSITTSPHTITIKSQGYLDKTINVKTIAGLRLNVFAKLAKDEGISASPSATPVPQSSTRTFVLIGKTPTGSLRLRTEPGLKGDEIADLKPGDKYLYLDTDTSTGWFKIQYEDPAPGLPEGITGWVSNQYSSLSTPSGTIK